MRTITLCTHVWGSLAIAGFLLGAADPAAAQSCDVDSDCGPGFVCHTDSYEGCSGEMCKPGVPCPPPTCETYESKYCVSAPCSADSDCPSSMLCYAPTYSECSGGSAMTPSCDPDSDCDALSPVDAGSPDFECHDVTGPATCTPRYQLPCQADADCGAGFACEEQRYTVCSGGGMGGSPADEPGTRPPVAGSAGSGVAGDGAAVDAGSGEAFECHEEASGSFGCRLLDLPCDSDADCADGLECQSNDYYPPCSVGGGTEPAMMGAAGSSSSDGEEPPKPLDAGSYDCPDPVTTQVCAPHNYYGGGMYPGGDGNGTGAGGGSGTGSSSDAGTTQPPSDPGPGSMNGGGSTGSGSDDDSAEEGEGHGHHGHGHHHPGHLPRFGCSVSDGEASSQLASFGLFGLIAFGLRRRARRS